MEKGQTRNDLTLRWETKLKSVFIKWLPYLQYGATLDRSHHKAVKMNRMAKAFFLIILKKCFEVLITFFRGDI